MISSGQKASICRWVEDEQRRWSGWHSAIWHFAEPAWREYRSAEWYTTILKSEGFSVEVGSGGMPTAFCTSWSNGKGPTILTYAEYDAVVGNCQAASLQREPRDGLSPLAPGHTDPHSALGISTLVGLLAVKRAMEQAGIRGTLLYMGEPAEKMQGSKLVHGLKGYYDGVDSIISFHPFYMLPFCNTARWDTHCGAYYSCIYSFEVPMNDQFLTSVEPIPQVHTAPRPAGANTAISLFHLQVKALQDSVLSHEGGWSLSEAFLTTGVSTADNLAAPLGQVQYSWRTPTLEMAEQILLAINRCAVAVSCATGTTMTQRWIARNRPGIANHALAEVAWRNIQYCGAPRFDEAATVVGRELQRAVGVDAMEDPFMHECRKLISPQDAETIVRRHLPSWQLNWTSDDYTEMTWYAPTVRFYIARPALRMPSTGGGYPAWVLNALGGIPATIDPMISSAAKVVGCTILDLMSDPSLVKRAELEFEERASSAGKITPLLPKSFEAPHGMNWPDYSYSENGRYWPVYPPGAV